MKQKWVNYRQWTVQLRIYVLQFSRINLTARATVAKKAALTTNVFVPAASLLAAPGVTGIGAKRSDRHIRTILGKGNDSVDLHLPHCRNHKIATRGTSAA